MPKDDAKRTKWARRNSLSEPTEPEEKIKIGSKARSKLFVIIIVLIIAGFIAFFLVFTLKKETKSAQTIPQKACLRIDTALPTCTFYLDIADSEATRIKGLSGRKSLADNEGMVFVFQQSEIQCFWMKGMLFPLDIIWLNDTKIITKIEKNVSPDTYPQQVCSDMLDKYVIELRSGTSDSIGLELGQKIVF